MSPWAPFLILLFCAGAQAQSDAQFEDFGGVPTGSMKIKLESEPLRKPVQLIGTLNPPTLLVNGQPVKLSTVEQNSDEDGLWLNGKQQTVQGKRGRFYIEAQEPIEIEFRSTGRAIQKATVDTETFFLARSFSVTEFRRDGKGPHQFEITGPLEADSKLVVEGADVFVQDGKAKLIVKLDEGKTTLTGKLISKTVLPFTLFLSVSAERSQEDVPVFRVYKGKGNPWETPRKGHQVRGLTNPNAEVTIGGKKVSVGSDGRFKFTLRPQAPTWVVPIRVKTKTQVLNLEQKARCLDCEPGDFDRRKRVRLTGGSGMRYNYMLTRLGVVLSDIQGWSVGFQSASFNVQETNAEYSTMELYFGWTLIGGRFDEQTWLELGATVKAVAGGDYRETQIRMARRNTVLSAFIRTELVKWRWFSLGLNGEHDTEANVDVWPEVNFTYHF